MIKNEIMKYIMEKCVTLLVQVLWIFQDCYEVCSNGTETLLITNFLITRKLKDKNNLFYKLIFLSNTTVCLMFIQCELTKSVLIS